MKTLKLLKEEYAILFCQYPSWEELLNDIPHHDIENHTDEVAKLFAKEVAKEALKNASENAEFIAEHQFYEETIKDSVDNVGSHLVFIDKQSILNESNIPEL